MNIQVKGFRKINSIINSKRAIILNGALLAVSFLFYLMFPLYDGPVWCVDSASYVSMNISREPLYPTFLALVRKVSDSFSGGGI